MRLYDVWPLSSGICPKKSLQFLFYEFFHARSRGHNFYIGPRQFALGVLLQVFLDLTQAGLIAELVSFWVSQNVVALVNNYLNFLVPDQTLPDQENFLQVRVKISKEGLTLDEIPGISHCHGLWVEKTLAASLVLPTMVKKKCYLLRNRNSSMVSSSLAHTLAKWKSKNFFSSSNFLPLSLLDFRNFPSKNLKLFLKTYL